MLLKTHRLVTATALAAVLLVQLVASVPVTCTVGSLYAASFVGVTPTLVTNSAELNAALLTRNTNATAAIITLTTTAAYNLTAGYTPRGDLCLQTDGLNAYRILAFDGARHMTKTTGVLQAIGITWTGQGLTQNTHGGFSLRCAATKAAFYDAVFTYNQAIQFGGAFQLTTSATLYVGDGSLFTRNDAPFGGAINADTNANFILGNNVQFVQNAVTNNAFGGAIYQKGSSRGQGGNGIVFDRNIVPAGGGAAYVDGASSLVLGNDLTVTSNEGGGGGGCFAISGASNMTVGDRFVAIGNTASGNGGCVRADGGSRMQWGDYSYWVNNTNNFAAPGGGVACTDGAYVQGGSHGYFGFNKGVNGAAISIDNSAQTNLLGSNNTMEWHSQNNPGGAMSVFGATSVLLMGSGNIFRHNRAGGGGGGIQVIGGARVEAGDK